MKRVLLGAVLPWMAVAGCESDPPPPGALCDTSTFSEVLVGDAGGGPADPPNEARVSMCLPRSADVSADGAATCIVVEARAESPCACTGGRSDVTAEHRPLADELIAVLGPDHDCACEIAQLTGVEGEACRGEGGEPTGEGWCYVDATIAPTIGDPELVAPCPSERARGLRFVGALVPPDSGVLVYCSESDCGTE
jgi:hypothetical protein